MTWEETRGSTRVGVGAARRIAHADDAKSRVDEATRVPTRSLSPRVLAGVGAGVVVLGLVAFLALRGGDDTGPQRAALVGETASPSPTPTEPTPAEVFADSQPTGVWKLRIVGRTYVQRDGASRPMTGNGEPARWTFPAAHCSDSLCSGAITSSSGRTFPFTWDGRRLDVDHGEHTARDPKAACVDTVTGEPVPIEQSAARITYHYRWPPFTGSPQRMVSKSTIRFSYEFFGTCEPAPEDTVRQNVDWILTPAPAGS
jgi:hypothetical protein